MKKPQTALFGISGIYNVLRSVKFLLITFLVSSLIACVSGTGSSGGLVNNNNNNNNDNNRNDNTNANLVSINIEPSNSNLPLRSTLQYKAIGKYSDGTTNDITNQVNWSVSNSAIARINGAGTLVAVSTGNVFVYAKDNVTGIQESAILNVIHSLQVGAPNGYTSGTAITSDSLGNKYVVGATLVGISGESQNGVTDYFIAKYDKNGNLIWSRQVGSPGGSTGANGVSIDNLNNIYVVGNTSLGISGEGQNGAGDYFIAKYDANGNLIWSRQVGSPGGNTGASGVSVDNLNNIYVSGRTDVGLSNENQNGAYDYFIAKYDINGNLKWSRQVGSAGGTTLGAGVSTDSSGHIYITGQTDTAISSGQVQHGINDYFIARYEPDGSLTWTKQGGASGGNTMGYGINADNSGKVYVVGNTNISLTGTSTLYNHTDYFLATYENDGTLVRTTQVGDTDPTSRSDVYGAGVETDSMGNVYVVGSTTIDLTDYNEQNGEWNAFIAKYGVSGNLLWTKQIGATNRSGDFGYGLTLDNSDVYITGYTNGGLYNQTQNGNHDYFIWGVSTN